MSLDGCRCLACTGTPSVAVGVEHEALRQLIVALLSRDDVTWDVCPCSLREMTHTATANEADVAIVATSGFPASWGDLLDVFPADKVVVIGPEPGSGYERAARAAGAGAWIARDRIGEDLRSALRTVLGCNRGPEVVALA